METLEDRTAPATLVAAYAFNEGTGTTVNDSSGNGNNGTIANATWTTSGKYGDALVFNGTNARVNINDSALLHLTTGMTLEAWVNPSTVSSAWRDVIYKGNDNYYLEATSTTSNRPAGGATLGSSAVETYGTAALAQNTWTYLAVTYDKATLRLVCQRRPGVEPGPDAEHCDVNEPVADRRRQHLRAVLPGDDRRSSGL